jgi:hypothetical protein
MHCLLLGLDLTNAKDTTIYAASSVAFHGICRSSKLCVPSHNLFDLSCHITNSAYIDFSTIALGVHHANFNIPWSKTTGTKGSKITITDINDPTSPVATLKHHKSANTNVPHDTPMFAFKLADGGREPLMKTNWLKRCNQIWVAVGFKPLKAHAFRIRGCTKMLLRGIHPDIVCILLWIHRIFVCTSILMNL